MKTLLKKSTGKGRKQRVHGMLCTRWENGKQQSRHIRTACLKIREIEEVGCNKIGYPTERSYEGNSYSSMNY